MNIYDYDFKSNPTKQTLLRKEIDTVVNIWDEGINLKINCDCETEYLSFAILDPIPFEPSILVMAGFEKYMAGQHDDLEVIGYRLGRYDIYHTENNTFHFADNLTEIELREVFSLHQVQNLVFELTGDELEITL